VSAVTGSPQQLEESGAEVLLQARRRRSFAVISHPDAGKTTLTEALALHGGAINEAGHVKGKSGRRGVVSDWQEMERARGISISSAALQFEHQGHVINLVDTPGHSDFSEDTYRVMTAVDCAVMLIDAAKGMERQTRKLFEVCRARGLPVITVINKWDRPGLSALELMDEIELRTGMVPTPLTWPVGHAGDFRGVLDRRTGGYITFARTAGGATRAAQEHLTAEQALQREGEHWDTAVEEADLLTATGAIHDDETFRPARSTTTRPFFPVAVPRCCSPQPYSTSASTSCSPCCCSTRRARRRGPTTPVGRGRWRHRSADRCSRSRPGWTVPTATGWPSSGSAPGSSNAA
jgi:peptide chain release factor 3